MSFDVATQAINQALTRFDDAALRVSAGPTTDGFVRAAVEMKAAQLETEAAVAVFKAVDENMGSLIDLLA